MRVDDIHTLPSCELDDRCSLTEVRASMRLQGVGADARRFEWREKPIPNGFRRSGQQGGNVDVVFGGALCDSKHLDDSFETADPSRAAPLPCFR